MSNYVGALTTGKSRRWSQAVSYVSMCFVCLWSVCIKQGFHSHCVCYQGQTLRSSVMAGTLCLLSRWEAEECIITARLFLRSEAEAVECVSDYLMLMLFCPPIKCFIASARICEKKKSWCWEVNVAAQFVYQCIVATVVCIVTMFVWLTLLLGWFGWRCWSLSWCCYVSLWW